MKALKEVEVSKKMQYRSKEDVIEKLYQTNIYYPYTVKRMLNSIYFKDYSLYSTEEDFNYLINSLEHFCHCLHQFDEVNSFNISNIAMSVISNKNIQEEIYSPDKNNNYNFNKKQKILHFKIMKALKRIDINEINSDLEKDGLYVDPLNENKKELTLIESEELEQLLIELVEKYNFAYSDILVKYIMEVDLGNLMKFKSTFSSRGIRKSRYNFLVFLNALNDLIHKIHITFQRDGMFLHKMIQLYILSKNETKVYIKIFLTKPSNNSRTRGVSLENRISYINTELLLKGFINGLLHTKELFVIKFVDFNNCNLNNFQSLSQDIKYNYLKQFFADLEDYSIYALYEVHDINDSEVFNYSSHLQKMKEDIEAKKSCILFKEQSLSKKEKDLIANIFSELKDNKRYKIKDACLSNLEQVGRILQFLTFKMVIKEYSFNITLAKNNDELVWYIYLNNQKIYREPCVCVEDLNRLFLILDKYK